MNRRPPRRVEDLLDEHGEQVVVVNWLKIRGWGVMAIPNARRPRNAQRLAAEGVLAGAPDLVLLQPAPALGRPVAIEMKRARGGVTSASQAAVHTDLRASGWLVYVCDGADAAIEVLSKLGYSSFRVAVDSARTKFQGREQ